MSRRPYRSSQISAAITISITQAIWAAPGRLERLSQVVKIESVKVRTPRYSDAPMSLSASIRASESPTASAGRASGSATWRASIRRVAPSVRATSNSAALCVWNIARAARKTYG